MLSVFHCFLVLKKGQIFEFFYFSIFSGPKTSSPLDVQGRNYGVWETQLPEFDSLPLSPDCLTCEIHPVWNIEICKPKFSKRNILALLPTAFLWMFLFNCCVVWTYWCITICTVVFSSWHRWHVVDALAPSFIYIYKEMEACSVLPAPSLC